MNKKTYNVAVVGATGAVGKTMLEVLQQRKFPIQNIYPLASRRSAGEALVFNGQTVRVGDLAEFDFNQVDIALFSAGGDVSAQYAAKVTAANCVMIDNTSHFRNQQNVPLVIPEVNPQAVSDYKSTGIIANPNCSTIQMLVALAPIYRKVGISRINVATYQSVSGAGNQGVDELSEQTRSLFNFATLKKQTFSQQIAFNVIPQIDVFQDNGYTKEEMKMVWETRKILEDDNIQVNPTCVRVPVFYGHSEAIHIETIEKITVHEVKQLMKDAAGVSLIDNPGNLEFPTPAEHATGNDDVFVGRIRADISHNQGINMWVVSDNIRKGAALNSVQIAEELLKILDKE